MDEVQARRAALRSAGRAGRRALVGPAREAVEAAVAAAVLASAAVAAADHVLTTRPLPGEVDLRRVRPALRARGARVLLPRVVGAHMEAVATGPTTPLRPGWRGLPEPAGPAVDPGTGRGWVVLVPGLAFDRRGGRLGQGGGHFDRWLARHPDAVPVGVALPCELREQPLPLLPHDVVMAEVLSAPPGRAPR